MPYLDRQNRTCGFLDIEENENSDKFYRRYFILDTHENFLLWYMDNPQNLPPGTVSVGSLRLSYISKVPKASPVAQSSDATNVSNPSQSTSRQAYKTEIVGGVVVHTPSDNEDVFTTELGSHVTLRRCQSVRPNVVRSGYCVKQGNVRKSWKRRFFILDDQTVSYYKSEMDKEPLRSIRLRDVLKVNECLVKSGDLLSRDNLFEIITSTRTFYIQADTPEDMKGWIKDIASKIQDFRGPSKVNILNIRFQSSLTSLILRSSSKVFSGQRKPQLVKSCSTADSWQPWTPVPNQEGQREGPYSSLPSLSHTGHAFQSTTRQTRQRHHSQPQLAPSETDFPDSLDHVRTTDV
uniref:Pleckstrin homology domain-containing family A member 2-like n=1 Tax=Sinocyclocheilus rhinocerous TaxID=307959 RepID=A0A673MLJ8_9TELE